MAFSWEKEEFVKKHGQKYGYGGTIDELRHQEFERFGDAIYLDSIAAAQYPKSLLDKYYNDISRNVYSNPHSGSPSSLCTTDAINEVRHRILQHFNTTADEYSVIFTAGATSSLRLLAESFDWQTSGGFCSCFCYLHSSHTSVVGIREVAVRHGAKTLSVGEEEIYSGHVGVENARSLESECSEKLQCPSLFAYPAMCNFSGKKYPLKWTNNVKNGILHLVDSAMLHPNSRWFILLDAASHISTSPLDLTACPADFIPISFYKLFGFPTGLGALLVRNSSASALRKTYYGGGTVMATITSERFHVLKKDLAERFEDGTLPYLDIIALKHAFETLNQLTGSMRAVSSHTFTVASYVHHKMTAMTHGNGSPVCQVYCGTDFDNEESQGPVINFNILRADGSCVGYSKVGRLANLRNIHLRTGCFCNTGACQQYLGLSNKKVKLNYHAGHVCGDQIDLVDGQPTGSVRISFGFMSNFSDAWHFLDFIRTCFIEKNSDSLVENCNRMYLRKEMDGNENKVQVSPEDPLSLGEICLYPVKSCAAFKVKRWQIGPRGFLYDRQWMIVNESGSSAVSQKREPRICLIQPSIDLENGTMTVSAAGMPSLVIPLQQTKKQTQGAVKVFGAIVENVDCGDEAADWLSNFLNKKYRLVQQASQDSRTLRGGKHSLSLANTSQYLLISQASAEAIKNLMDLNCEGSEKLDVTNICDRFRANLVIHGGRPFAEDSWHTIQIGTELFQFQSLCVRCQMVGHDQESGRKTTEPLTTLGRIRRQKSTTFGINVNHLSAHDQDMNEDMIWLHVGDNVKIMKI